MGGTNHNRCTQTCTVACTDLLMHPDRAIKLGQTRTYFTGQIRQPRKSVNRHFQFQASCASQPIECLLGRPTYSCRRSYILPRILLSFFLLFFRRIISELAERNSTTVDHMLGSNCNLITHVQNLGYPVALQIGGTKTTFLGEFAPLWQLHGNFMAYIFGTEHDIDNQSSTLTTRLQEVSCIVPKCHEL